MQLLPLPDNPFNTDDIVAVHVGKTPYARFDFNDYSVAHTYVQRIVTIRATPDRDPEPALGTIVATLLAINSADDQINPPELGIMEREIIKTNVGGSSCCRSPRKRAATAHIRCPPFGASISRNFSPLPKPTATSR